MAGTASGNCDDWNVWEALTNFSDHYDTLCVRQEQVTDEKVRLAPNRRFQGSRQPCPIGHAMTGPPKGGRKSLQYERLIINNDDMVHSWVPSNRLYRLQNSFHMDHPSR